MEIDDLRKLSLEKLLEKKNEIELAIIVCQPKMIKPIVPIGKRKDIKKTYARILTLLNEKRKRRQIE